MAWLNYHHLLYFWTVAREGSVTAACVSLHLTQPTISAQVRALERTLGQKLFAKAGRNLALTDAGKVVFRYADEIFSLGHEMVGVLASGSSSGSTRLVAGVSDALPKMIVYRLLAPAMQLAHPVQLVCLEAAPPQLLARLSLGELDVVLSDAPIDPHVKVRAYNHMLGECGMSAFATRKLAARYRQGFPQSLNGAPMLLPTKDSISRRALDRWMVLQDIHPVVAAELQDSALMKSLGQSGAGVFLAPTVIEHDVQRQYGVVVVGRLPEIREQYYAISVERRVRHPAVVAITEASHRFFTK